MIARAEKPIDGLSLVRRFIEKVEVADPPEGIDSPCWLWTAGVNTKGYPMLWAAGQMRCAHRISHELFVGKIPEGEQVHHRCMNIRCVNPLHLEAMSAGLNRHLQALGLGALPEPNDEIPF